MKYKNRELFEHPTYKGYFADEEGMIYHLKNGVLTVKHQFVKNGYYNICGTIINCKTIPIISHRFIYECNTNKLLPKITKKNFNSKTIVVDHIDNNKLNNRIENLQAISQSDNTKKYHRIVGHYDHDGTSRMPIQLTNDPKMRVKKRAMHNKRCKKLRNNADYRKKESDYQKNYLNNPLKKLINNEFGTFLKLKTRLSLPVFIKNNLSNALFIKLSKAKSNNLYPFHVISIYNFLHFKEDLPRCILHDNLNVELHPERPHNYRLITDHTIVVATKLESKYPDQLNGLTYWLLKQKT